MEEEKTVRGREIKVSQRVTFLTKNKGKQSPFEGEKRKLARKRCKNLKEKGKKCQDESQRIGHEKKP